MRRIALALVAATALTPAVAQTDTRSSVVTQPPNAPDQQPAFENQTRAPQPAESVATETEVVASDLPQLWALEFLPDGQMLVTTKDGAMHIIADGTPGAPIGNVPEVDARGQGGLLDVALAPDFDETGTIFFSYAEPRGSGENATAVARAELVRDGDTGTLENVEVIFQQTPTYAGTKHFGSRLAFADDGKLFITVGERSDTPIRDRAQDLSAGLGKVFRVNQDGSIPQDNPFVDDPEAQDAIWSYGHRNLQSAIVASDGTLWTVEHGPRGGDELNMPEPGKNYGWPVITYGLTYGGQEVGEGITQQEGMEQPVYYWDPVIAPSGMAQYSGDVFPSWEGNFLIGGLVTQDLVILDVEDGRVVTEERVPLGARVRDVKVGPDGAVYAVTESRSGSSEIVRVTADTST